MDLDVQQMLIDGDLVAAEGGREYDNVNPATEQVVGTAPDASVADVDRAVTAARRAFEQSRWSTDVDFRRDCLLQLQAQLRKDVETIRAAHTAETGMPVGLAHAIGVDGPIENLSYYADLIPNYEWQREIPVKTVFGTPSRRVVRKEAAGVVSAITPWNYPFQLNITKIAASLAAGCTVVLKPAPETPWSGTLLAAAAAQTDIPAGVLNVITTSDNAVAELLTSHAEVDQITFTGSTATGRRIMRNAADTIKRVSLELGGKSAAIVLEDADLAASVGAAAGTICMHAGQGCALPTRLLVPRHLMDRAAEIAAAVVGSIPYGDPTDMGNLMGPLITQRQYERVLEYIEIGKQEGRLVLGGGRATQFDQGWFVQPTVFADVPNLSRIAQEEIFGPVLAIVPFDDDDDAVRVANESPFGLSGAVFGGDLDRAMRVAARLRTGTISVNGGQFFDPETPFGGYKQSGLGREWGPEGLEDYLETKTIGYPAP
ncbi:MAG: aldehyde dehydrogenase family protein [Frankiales bacterium]|nr:aldehyde dehydrogenase family protein [Frankiales bacterium]